MESSKGGMMKDFKEEDAVKQRTGVGVEEIIGTLRNQILSPPRKALHLGSKMFLRRSAAKRDQKLMDLMLDTRGIVELGTAAARVEAAANAGAATQKLVDSVSDFAKQFAKRGRFLIVKGATLADAGNTQLQEQMEEQMVE
jgi:hypothetical protein